jgi:hypothetical protein
MSALDGVSWRVVGCGNLEHGPQWKCWKVKNERDEAVLYGVDKPTAERYAAFPVIVRALLAVYEHDKRFRESPEDPNRSPILDVTAALVLAGVPLP